MSETPSLSLAHLGGLGNGGWRGALRIAQRQAPLHGEGLGERGGRLPSEAGVEPFGVVVDEPGYQRDTGSIITAAEFRCGCARKGSAKLLANVEAILGSIEVLALYVPADAEYGGNRAELEASGKPIGPNDLLITAHAYSLGAILVTANTGEFTWIRGLQIENWLSPA